MLSIHKAEYQHKSTLRNLMELYKYDFTEYDPEDVNENGLYEYVYLDHYWTETGRHPFLFRVEGQLAGFALIREIGSEQGTRIYQMAEFFVMKKYRKLGMGAQAAIQLFNLFPGTWKVAELETNVPAQAFWRKVVARYTHNKYQEVREPDWEGPIQIFTTCNNEKGENRMSQININSSTSEESEYVRQQLIEFNAAHVSEELRHRYEELNFNIKNGDGEIVAGVLSTLCWNWLEVDILWVDAEQRQQGYGSQLLREVERIAREKSCDFIQLNTFSYQAPEFYKKHGYQLITTIENAPTGHRHYYFKKDLT